MPNAAESGPHDYPHDHWCSWREVYVKAEDELERAHKKIARLEQQLRASEASLNRLRKDARACGHGPENWENDCSLCELVAS